MSVLAREAREPDECWLCARELEPTIGDLVCEDCGHFVCTYHAIRDRCIACVEEAARE